MKAHAEITCRNGGHILEVGFGMGISATIFKNKISNHTQLLNSMMKFMRKQLSGQKINLIQK